MVKFYEKTGMYIDWDQLDKLPEIDIFIDIGVGPKGTPTFWKKYKDKRIICIDPLPEAQEITSVLLQGLDFSFFNCALGAKKSKQVLNVEKNKGRSSFLQPTKINIEDKNSSEMLIEVNTLDDVTQGKIHSERVGIKIDTEGYELDVIKGLGQNIQLVEFIYFEHHYDNMIKKNYKFSEIHDFLLTNGFQRVFKIKMPLRKSFDYIYSKKTV